MGGIIFKQWILACFLFFSLFGLVYSSARSSIELADIDALIAERRMNEALRATQKYLKQNPLEFDAVQKRINLILDAKNGYNLLAEELMRVIVDEPLNDKKKLQLIAELQNLEKNPSEYQSRFLEETKQAAQFTYYRALFEKIMTEGTNLLNQKEYVAAIQRFSDGFSLYYDEFIQSESNSNIKESVQSQLTVIKKFVATYEPLQDRITTAFLALNTALENKNIFLVQNALAQLETVMQEYKTIVMQSTAIGEDFKNIFLTLQKNNPSLTEASFLPFAYRFILGRDDTNGIITVMDKQWDTLWVESRNYFTQFIEFYSDTVVRNISNTNVDSLVAKKDIINGYVETLLRVNTYGYTFYGLNHPNDYTANKEIYMHTPYQHSLEYLNSLTEHVNSLLVFSQSYVKGETVLNSLLKPQQSSIALWESIDSYFLVMNKNLDILFTLIKNVKQEQQAIEENHLNITQGSFTNKNYFKDDLQSWEALYTTLANEFTQLVDQGTKKFALLWTELAQFQGESATTLKAIYQQKFDDTVVKINRELDPSRISQPDVVLSDFTVMNTQLKPILKALENELLIFNQTDFKELSTAENERVQSGKTEIQNVFVALSNIVKNIGENISVAQNQIVLSEQAKNEADIRFLQAKGAVEQGNYNLSRDLLLKARAKYSESLALKEDVALRKKTDADLAQLGNIILVKENEQVVYEVRALIKDARGEYYNSDFERAEQYILQAETRWFTTNVDANTEITNLKALISHALSIKTGRVILVTDPLYPEMSQTLNIAFQLFEQGKQLLAQNKKTLALEVLSDAMQKIKNIQLLYPLNQEAGLLSLQIDKLIDPVAFKDLFKRKYEKARADYQNKKNQNVAYADLKDLYEINPSYPGLKQLIYNIEVDLGIIIPPPDPKLLVRSTQLTKEALKIYNANRRDEVALNNALSRLTEALTLNPDNEEAMVLSDRIKTSLGGQALVVLPAAQEALYQQAVQELARGNTITAASIVAQLWEDTAMQRSAKIIDLKQKVDSLL